MLAEEVDQHQPPLHRLLGGRVPQPLQEGVAAVRVELEGLGVPRDVGQVHPACRAQHLQGGDHADGGGEAGVPPARRQGDAGAAHHSSVGMAVCHQVPGVDQLAGKGKEDEGDKFSALLGRAARHEAGQLALVHSVHTHSPAQYRVGGE